jgi:ribonuclease P protein component
MPPVVGRIRKQATFRALSRPDGRAQRGAVAVAFSGHAPEVAGLPLAGYAIGKRHGGAVERNRLRRRLRAALRASGEELPAGAYLVRAAPAAAELGFEELRRAVRAAAQAAAGKASGEERGAL